MFHLGPQNDKVWSSFSGARGAAGIAAIRRLPGNLGRRRWSGLATGVFFLSCVIVCAFRIRVVSCCVCLSLVLCFGCYLSFCFTICPIWRFSFHAFVFRVFVLLVVSQFSSFNAVL